MIFFRAIGVANHRPDFFEVGYAVAYSITSVGGSEMIRGFWAIGAEGPDGEFRCYTTSGRGCPIGKVWGDDFDFADEFASPAEAERRAQELRCETDGISDVHVFSWVEWVDPELTLAIEVHGSEVAVGGTDTQLTDPATTALLAWYVAGNLLHDPESYTIAGGRFVIPCGIEQDVPFVVAGIRAMCKHLQVRTI